MKRTLLSIALMAGLLFAASSGLASDNKGAAKEDKKAEDAAQHLIDASALSVFNPPAEPYTDKAGASGEAQTPADQAQSSQRSTPDNAWRWNLAADVALVLLTLVVVAVSAFQAWIARENGRRQLRAYVNIKAMHLHPGGGMKIWVLLQNTGQTPATEFQIRSAFVVRDGWPEMPSRRSSAR